MTTKLIDRPELMDKINAAFRTRDCLYDIKWAQRKGRLDGLNAWKVARMASGAHLEVSQQISLEAQWLINYTEQWQRADWTLDRLEQSLKGEDQRVLAQLPDGSWAPGCTEFYRKLEPTIDALQSDEVLEDDPTKKLTLWPLTFMQPLQNPDFVEAYLDRLKVTDVRNTGRNNRDEFGSVIASMSQLIFKSSIASALALHPEAEFTVSPELKQRFTSYLWRIQNSKTGYWGPTYDFDGEFIDVQDVSYTFHVAKYYTGGMSDPLPRLDELIDTTQAIEALLYPNGLKPEPPDEGPAPLFSDHNNYDLATLFKILWRKMSPAAQKQAAGEIKTLLGWCLTKSLQHNDHFAPSANMSALNSYYYGVQFLLVAGFWPQLAPYWTDNGAPPPVPPGTLAPVELAKKLRAAFASVDDNSEMAGTVKKILNAAIS